ncbi:hypothetical protein [Bowmanella denitrificans]|uniref:hypothetical protein n=1 Tax=Bowmanella denitrificans TaxID=366582 RepID=UPI001C0F2C1C|nr:hypothetical protein [Bowmanella denitrificans]
MDTSQLENEAESYISSRLANAGLLVAKPKFDHLGTDLLVFSEMNDGLKFCRIQCKGRSFKASDSTNISIPTSYISDAFIVFLYIGEPKNEPLLYLFFPNEIKKWNIKKGSYQLNLSKNHYEEKLSQFKVTSLKMTALKKVIEAANVTGEFKQMIVSEVNFSIPGPKFSIHASVSTGKNDD